MVSNELLLAYSFCVRTREVTNRGLLDMAHLPLSPQSVSVSFCFCFPNLFQLLVSVLFMFLFSQSVNASDGETVRPQDRDYVFAQNSNTDEPMLLL